MTDSKPDPIRSPDGARESAMAAAAATHEGDATPADHRAVIDRWPSLSAFAGDIVIPYGNAKAMRRRNSIPPELWVATVEAAERREIAGVTYELLAQITAGKRRQSLDKLVGAA